MSHLSLDDRRLQLRLLYHLAVAGPVGLALAVGTAGQLEGLVATGIAILVFHLLTFRRSPLIPLLERAVLTLQGCPVCGYVISLNNWWRCSCGYTGFRERHVLAPCRNCGKEFSWLTCPNCETQIPL